MKSLFDSKRSQARVYIGIVIFLFLFGFMNIVAYSMLNEFIDAFIETGIYGSLAEAAVNPILGAFRLMDYVIVFMVIVFAVGIALTSYRVAVSPAFYALQFFAIIFYGMISFFFNFIFQQLITNTFFDAARLVYTNTIIVCTNLHWVLLAHFIVGTITFFAKKEKGQFT